MILFNLSGKLYGLGCKYYVLVIEKKSIKPQINHFFPPGPALALAASSLAENKKKSVSLIISPDSASSFNNDKVHSCSKNTKENYNNYHNNIPYF